MGADPGGFPDAVDKFYWHGARFGAGLATLPSFWKPRGEVRSRQINKNTGLEVLMRCWSYESNVLDGSGRSRNYKTNVLEGFMRRWSYKNIVLEGSRRRWNYKNTGFSDHLERHGGLQRCQQLLSGTPLNHAFSI